MAQTSSTIIKNSLIVSHRSIGIIFVILITTTHARITDFSHAKYVPVLDGNVLLWKQRSYVRHSTNLSNFVSIIEDTIKLSQLFPKSHMRKLLEVDIDHMQNSLSSLTIHHRIARSLDFLGTALKVVAGTPDAADLEKIKFIEAQLVESNNKQVIVITEAQKQINALTDTVNKLIKEKRNEFVDSPHLYETLLARNRMLITEIQNIMLTITLAKSNVINPTIFDHDDLKSIFTEQLTEVPIVSLMGVSNIKIFQSNSIIHILVEYPKVKSICKKVLIYPVAHNNTVLQIHDNIVAECEDGVLPVTECATTNYATFCKVSTLETCASGLHSGGTALCHTQPSHLEPLTIVDEGIVIINDQTTRIRIDDGPIITTRGTHLITFERVATINDSTLINYSRVVKKSPGIAASPLLNITGHNNVLSLAMLHRMNEHNLHAIREVKDEASAERSPKIWFAAGVILSLVLYSISFIYQCWHRRSSSIKLQALVKELSVTEDGNNLKGGIVNNQVHERPSQ